MSALPNPFISESAPVSRASQNTAEGNPSVMPDCAGAGPLESSSVVERRTVNSDVAGSSPASSANDWEAAIDDMIAGFPAPPPQSDANDHRFVLDVESFEAAIEPAPLFLQRGRA